MSYGCVGDGEEVESHYEMIWYLSGVSDSTELFRRLKREEKRKSCSESVHQSNVVLSCFTRMKFVGASVVAMIAGVLMCSRPGRR